MDLSVFTKLSYGVYIISSIDGEKPVGFTANSVMQVTSEPATVAVSVNHDNYTNGCIKKSGKFSVSIASEKCDGMMLRLFGFRSSKDYDKFQGVDYEFLNGVPVIKTTVGAISAEVIDTLETSTHTIFLGKVTGTKVYDAICRPMTYSYYHEVVKGKTAKNAPTYIPK